MSELERRPRDAVKQMNHPPGYAFVSATRGAATYGCEFCNERVVALDRHNDTCRKRPKRALDQQEDAAPSTEASR